MSSTFEWPVTIKFHQADPAGIMFFGHVFTLAHDGYEEFVRHLGYSWPEWFQNKHFALPIRHTSADYFKPFFAGETYLVNISLSEIGDNHLKFNFEFFKEKVLHARVEMVQVSFDPQSRQKSTLPAPLKQKLQDYLRGVPHGG